MRMLLIIVALLSCMALSEGELMFVCVYVFLKTVSGSAGERKKERKKGKGNERI